MTLGKSDSTVVFKLDPVSEVDGEAQHEHFKQVPRLTFEAADLGTPL